MGNKVGWEFSFPTVDSYKKVLFSFSGRPPAGGSQNIDRSGVHMGLELVFEFILFGYKHQKFPRVDSVHALPNFIKKWIHI